MSGKKIYDEEHELPSPWEWVIITVFSTSIMAFGWMVYCLVHDGPRQWDFGQLPDTPAESIYSTDEPKAPQRPQRQLLRLPEAPPEKPTASQAK